MTDARPIASITVGAAGALVLYENARRALGVACRVDEVKTIYDKAVAMQVYAKRARDRELIEQATELRLYAERRAGELLNQMAERGERAKGGEAGRRELPRATLADLGVTKTESHRWRKVAAFDDEAAFALRVTLMKRQAVSPAALSKADNRERRAEREAALGRRQCALPEKRYGVVYADPPWRWETWSRATGLDRAAEAHYSSWRPGASNTRPVSPGPRTRQGPGIGTVTRLSIRCSGPRATSPRRCPACNGPR
jgi:hypothetical protein